MAINVKDDIGVHTVIVIICLCYDLFSSSMRSISPTMTCNIYIVSYVDVHEKQKSNVNLPQRGLKECGYYKNIILFTQRCIDRLVYMDERLAFMVTISGICFVLDVN